MNDFAFVLLSVACMAIFLVMGVSMCAFIFLDNIDEREDMNEYNAGYAQGYTDGKIDGMKTFLNGDEKEQS